MVVRALRWIKERLKDLFYDSTNNHLDVGRCIAAICLLILNSAIKWNMHLGKEINLAELGGCLSAILAGLVIYIYHDRKTNASQ